MDAYAAPSRRTQILWGLRYYGFVGGLLLLGLAIIVLTALVLMKPTEQEPELTAEDLARMEASAPRPRGAVQVPLEPAYLTIETVPSDASVLLNGEASPSGSWTDQELRPGYHLLSVTRDGYAARDTLIEVTEGARSTITLALVPEGQGASGRREASDVLSVRPAGTPPQQRERSLPPANPPVAAETPAADVGEEEPSEARPAPPATGAIAVVSDPVDARVILNGEPVGDAPMFLEDLPVGEHEILVHAPGYAAATHFVTVEEGRRQTIRISLDALQGTLSVIVRPWGSIYLNGQLVKRDTDVLYSTTLSSGFHTIEVMHPTLGRESRSVEVRPGLTTRVVFELNSN